MKSIVRGSTSTHDPVFTPPINRWNTYLFISKETSSEALTNSRSTMLCMLCLCFLFFVFLKHFLLIILNLNAVKSTFVSTKFFFYNRKKWDQCWVKASPRAWFTFTWHPMLLNFFYVALFKFVSTQQKCTPLIDPHVSICEQHFICKHWLRGRNIIFKIEKWPCCNLHCWQKKSMFSMSRHMPG